MSPVQRPDGQERERRDAGASFAGAIAGRPGRPPLLLVVFLAAVGGLAVVGIGGRLGGAAGASQAPSGGAAIASAAAVEPPPSDGEVPEAPTPRPSLGQAPIVVSPAGSSLALTIRRHPETLFVHGDIYPVGVTWVFVNIVDIEGRVAAWTQVSMPGGTGASPEGKPAMRFDVELALPPWSIGPLWVQGTAYDGSGAVVAQEKLGVWPDGAPMTDGPFADTTSEPVRLDSTSTGPIVVTGTTLTVSGALQVEADAIEIQLFTPDRRLLAERTVRTADLDGGIRPDSLPDFEVRLGVPEPRPNDEQAWLVIVALDGDGMAIGFQRHEVLIAALAGAP